MKIEEAIEAASEGSKILIGPGTYYERPLVIQKSLVLQGAAANHTEIRTVDPGAAITIRSSSSISVTIQGITIETPLGKRILMMTEESPVGVQVEQVEETSKELFVFIKESEIRSVRGVGVKGKIQITLQKNIIFATAYSLAVWGSSTMGETKVIAQENYFFGPDFPLGFPYSLLTGGMGVMLIGDLGNTNIQAFLQRNEIEGWAVGLVATSVGHLGKGRIYVFYRRTKLSPIK